MYTPLQVYTQVARAHLCQSEMARCRVVYTSVGTPLQVYPQTISTYEQDNLAMHPPLQVGTQITRAYYMPQRESCQVQLHLNLIFLIFKLIKVKGLAYCVPSYRKFKEPFLLHHHHHDQSR